MQYFSMNSMPMMTVNDDGVYVETKKYYDNIDVDADKGEVLDPKNLPDVVQVIDKDTTNNDWHKSFEGCFIPGDDVPDLGAFMAVNSEASIYAEMNKRAAEIEKIAHDNAMNNPINLASQMYDLMSMYHKKMEY